MIVSDGDLAAGASTFWGLRGEANRADLVSALRLHDLGDYLPKAVEAETALRRAVGVLRGKRRLIRPIKRGVWAVVEEALDVTKENLKHWPGPTVRLDKVGRAVLENATTEEAQQVRDAYDHYLDVLDTTDVSGWLLTQLDRLTAVGLRPGGGFYYVPPSRVAEWLAIRAALADAHPQHQVYLMPTVRMTEDGARAILDALVTEVSTKIDDVTAELVSGDLGLRALDTRSDQSKALLAKVTQYENLLDSKLETLRANIAKLDVDMVAAVLAAEALRDEAV
jgi:hypothetical protein